MKQEENESVQVYYEWIQKLAYGLQLQTTNSFLTTVFKAGLQSYFRITTTGMKQLTIKQNKKATMLCEKGMTIVETRMHFQYQTGNTNENTE